MGKRITPTRERTEPSSPISTDDFDRLCAWRREGTARAIHIRGSGVALISYEAGERRAEFPSATEALAAIAAGSVEWRDARPAATKTRAFVESRRSRAQ